LQLAGKIACITTSTILSPADSNTKDAEHEHAHEQEQDRRGRDPRGIGIEAAFFQ
jgi:hypothetical protein